MSKFFTEGETKVRPGVYKRYFNAGASNGAAGAMNGVVAIAIQASWGPVGTVTTHTDASTIKETYGDCTGVNVALKALEAVNAVGTSPKIYVTRLQGTGGAAATATIGSVATVTAKHVGNYPLKVKVQAKLSDATKKEVIILSGNSQKEKFEFVTNESDESEAFVAALADSKFVTATKKSAGVISAQETELSGGTNPTCNNNDYLAGYEALEPYSYNVIISDSIESGVSSILKNYVDSAYMDGKNAIAVVGSASSVDFSTRKANAAAMNDEKVVYFGSGYKLADGTTVDGAEAVAYIAGLIAATPSNRSIVHTQISGSVDVTEKLTNSEYEEAINSGLLLLSIGPDGQVWVDSGINTLITPNENQDAGWKKIKRVKVRFELFDRIDKVLEPKIGKVNCDADGIAYLIQCGSDVVEQMKAEGGKIATGSFALDPNMGYQGDSSWFVIEIVDIDTLEKIYLHYQFKYSQV